MTTDTDPPRLAPSVDDAIFAIRAYVRYKGWSIPKLAAASGLDRSSLRYIHEIEWAPKTETLRVLYSLIPPDFDPNIERNNDASTP
jgi:hypothetical protein